MKTFIFRIEISQQELEDEVSNFNIIGVLRWKIRTWDGF